LQVQELQVQKSTLQVQELQVQESTLQVQKSTLAVVALQVQKSTLAVVALQVEVQQSTLEVQVELESCLHHLRPPSPSWLLACHPSAFHRPSLFPQSLKKECLALQKEVQVLECLALQKSTLLSPFEGRHL